MKTIDVYNSDESVLKMLTQWDRDVYIYFRNDDMYKADEVHFYNSQSDSSYVVSATEEADGRIKVKIPNVLLEQPYTITALAFIEYDNGFRAGYRSFINVTPRPHPDNFISEDSEDYHMITELKKEVLEKMAEYAEESGRYYQPQVNSEGVLTWGRSSNSLPELPQSNIKGTQGDSGGYYTPSVSDDGVLSWTPSEGTMTPVQSANIRGSQGEPGKSPYIGDNNHWFVWDGTKWVDTKVNASGGSAGVSDYEDLTNKPTLNNVEISGDKTASDYGIVVPDVPDWALEENKPSYTAEEVGALPSDTEIPTVPTDVSAFENDAGYITSVNDKIVDANTSNVTLYGTNILVNNEENAKTIEAALGEKLSTADKAVKTANLDDGSITTDKLGELDAIGRPTLVVPIDKGGTGAVTRALAFANLGGVNPNLIMNAWFNDNLVNQRNVTSWTTGFGIDRWQGNNTKLTATVLSSKQLQLDNTDTAEHYIFQRFEGYQVSGIYRTLSINVGGVIHTKTGDGNITILDKNNRLIAGFYPSPTVDKAYVSIRCPANSTVTAINAIKLEYGVISTLENDSAPDYQTELLRCMRFMQKFSPYVAIRVADVGLNVIQTSVPLTVPMKETELTIINPSNLVIRTMEGTTQTGFTPSVSAVGTNFLRIGMTKQRHGITDGYLRTENTGVFFVGELL